MHRSGKLVCIAPLAPGCFDISLGAYDGPTFGPKGLTLTRQFQEHGQDVISTLVQYLLNDRIRAIVQPVHTVIPPKGYFFSPTGP